MGQLWCKMYNTKCAEGVTDVKFDGTEKVWCAGA